MQKEVAPGRAKVKRLSNVALTVWLILPFVVIGVLWLLIDPEAMRKHRAEMEARDQRMEQVEAAGEEKREQEREEGEEAPGIRH